MKILDKFLKGGKVQDDKLPRDDKGNVVYGPAGDADPDQLTFSEAFADAKRAGVKRFKWKGKWYTTETKDEQNRKTMEKMKKEWEGSYSLDEEGKPIPRKKYPKKPKVTRKYEEGGKTEKPKNDTPPKKESKDKPTPKKKSDNKPTQKKENNIPFTERTQHNTEIKTADDEGLSDAYFHVDEKGNKTRQRVTNQRERQRAEDKRNIKKDDRDYVSSSGEVDIHSIPDKRDAQFEADERSYKTQRKERRKERDAKSEWTGSGKPRQLDLEDKEGRNKYEQRIDREILGDQGAKSSYVGPTRGQDDTKYAVTDHQRKFDNNIFGRRNIETNRKTKGTYKVQDVDATGDNRVREYGDTVQIKEGHGKTEKFKVKKKGPKRGHIDGIKYKTRKTRRNEQQYLGQDEDGNWIKNPKYNKRKKVTKSGFWGLNRKKEWVDDEDYIKPNENLVASKRGSIVGKYMEGGTTEEFEQGDSKLQRNQENQQAEAAPTPRKFVKNQQTQQNQVSNRKYMGSNKGQDNEPNDAEQPEQKMEVRGTLRQANYRSWDELQASQEYKRALRSKQYKYFTYWGTSSDCPDCPEYRVVHTVILNPKSKSPNAESAPKNYTEDGNESWSTTSNTFNKGGMANKRRYMGGGHVAQGGSTKAMMSKGGKVRKGKKKGMAVIIAIGKPRVNKKSKKGHACG